MTQMDIVVIGASAGGVNALKRLVSLLPEDLSAALFVVQHLPPQAHSVLHDILSRNGPLPAAPAAHGGRLKAGTITVAPPNFHLIVKVDHVAVILGPRENRARPSIDVLFRSAAAYHTTRVKAILLTGYLNDGVKGLSAVKRCGGVVVVQRPDECEASDLPQAAIDRVAVDRILSLDEIAEFIANPIPPPDSPSIRVPEDILEDVRVSEHVLPELDRMHANGRLTPYSCPECGGALWRSTEGAPTRYRCHTGHAFSQDSFLQGQADVIENSLWSVIRLVQERIDILQTMIAANTAEGRHAQAGHLENKMEEMKHHVRTLRRSILSGILKLTTENKDAETG
ncbi:MAG: chemotaxis protein CheB [Desulfosarcina sp.]